MRGIIFILLALLALHPSAFGLQEALTDRNKSFLFIDDGIPPDDEPIVKTPIIANLGIPEISPDDHVISHTGFSLLYSEIHEQAIWVAYELTSQKTHKIYERTDKFLIDPNVLTGTSTHTDYRRSGYDRGHLAPAADMAWASTAMSESFYYSNISPQNSSFNRGIWKRMEGLIRTWAMENSVVHVITGPVLTDGLEKIGANKVSVPSYFYKVILDYTDPYIKGMGFIVPNIGSKKHLQQYAVSIDSVEKFTGINFFPLLSEEQGQIIEKTLCIECWSWKAVK